MRCLQIKEVRTAELNHHEYPILSECIILSKNSSCSFDKSLLMKKFRSKYSS